MSADLDAAWRDLTIEVAKFQFHNGVLLLETGAIGDNRIDHQGLCSFGVTANH